MLAVDQGEIAYDSITSPSLEGNVIGNSATKSLTAYLPPGYDRQLEERYPTIYFLHGAMRLERIQVSGRLL